jgi:hypothetical protein
VLKPPQSKTLARGPGILEMREAFGVRRVHRRFCCRCVVKLQHFNRDFQITVA